VESEKNFKNLFYYYLLFHTCFLFSFFLTLLHTDHQLFPRFWLVIDSFQKLLGVYKTACFVGSLFVNTLLFLTLTLFIYLPLHPSIFEISKIILLGPYFPYFIYFILFLFYFILLYFLFYFVISLLLLSLTFIYLSASPSIFKFIIMFLIIIDFCWAMHSGIQTTLLIFATLPLFNVLQVYPSIVISFQPHSLSYIRYPISYPISYIRYPISYTISYIRYPISCPCLWMDFGVDQSLAERVIRTLLTIFFSYLTLRLPVAQRSGQRTQ